MYELRLVRSAQKELDGLPDAIIARIARVLDTLPANPRPRGSKKLKGATGLWRIRVGAYRIIYHVDDRARSIEVRAIGDRKDVYG